MNKKDSPDIDKRLRASLRESLMHNWQGSERDLDIAVEDLIKEAKRRGKQSRKT